MISRIITTSFFLLFSHISFSEENYTIVVSVDDGGKFDVLYHRAESTATGAVIGGFIGAAIEEGARGGKDEDKKEALLPYVTNPSCEALFITELNNKLEQNGFKVLLDSSVEQENSLLLKIDIDRCGYKLVDSFTNGVSAFTRFKATLFDKNRKQHVFEEMFYITSRKQQAFEELLESSSGINKQFNSVLAKAGRRLANKITYRK